MIYFTVDLFVDALILVLHFNTAEVHTLINRLITIYEEETKNNTESNEIFEFYINLIKEIITLNLNINNTAEIDTFILKFKGNPLLIKDPELYTSLRNTFTNPIAATPEKYNYLVSKLRNCFVWYNTTKDIKKLFSKLASSSINSPLEKQNTVLSEISEICGDIIKLNKEKDEAEDTNPIRVRFLDFSDKDNIKRALISHTKITKLNRFITGLQGLNRALGGGYPLGSSIVYNSVAHHGKTYMLLKMARWQVTLNKPTADLINPTCLIYSLENETPLNLVLLFNELYINTYNTVPPKDIPDEQIVDFCYDTLAKHGWKLIIDRRLGAEFGFYDLVANFEEYIREGFTPLMCVIDYMNMMKKGSGYNSDEGKNYLALRELYTNTCNYMKSKNCTLVTAHQLNRKAVELIRTNPIGAVKKFSPDMLADGMDPQREVDIVFYQCKEKDSAGRVFMTYKLDKYRQELTIPEAHKYFAYMFNGELGIQDDVFTEDASTTNIYSVPFEKGESETTESSEVSTTNLFT